MIQFGCNRVHMQTNNWFETDSVYKALEGLKQAPEGTSDGSMSEEMVLSVSGSQDRRHQWRLIWQSCIAHLHKTRCTDVTVDDVWTNKNKLAWWSFKTLHTEGRTLDCVPSIP